MNSDVKSVLRPVVMILQDATSVRWTANELVMWVNEAMTSTAVLRPDATARRIEVALTGGNYYRVDDLLVNGDPKALRFMRLIRNTAPESKLGFIRSASMTAMDAILPTWRTTAAKYDIVNFLTDPEDSLGFYTYPAAPVPASTGPSIVAPAKVELMYSAIPTPVAFVNEGQVWEDVEGTLATETVFDTALAEYVLARAFSKDSEYGGNGQRSSMHMNNYTQALAYDAQGSTATKTQKKASS